MKNTFKKAAIAATLVSGLGAGMAQAETFQALLSIVEPLALSNTTQMDLGQIVPASNGDTCQITDAAGSRTGTACFDDATPGVAGVFLVEGSDGLAFNITLGSGTVDGMTFAPSMINNGEGATSLTGVTLQTIHNMTLGGTLTVDDATTAAASTASQIDYDVSVVYN